VNNGQGAYDKNQNFILIESSTISDYDKLTKGLASLKASDSGSSTVSALRNALTELEGAKLSYDQAVKTISECQKALEQAKTGSDKTAITKAENNLAAANTKKTTAEGVLNSDLTAYNALVDTDSQISVVTTETLATAEKLVQTQQSSVTEYTDALNKMTVMQKVSDLFYNQGGTTTLDADQDYVYTLNGQAIASDAALQKALASHLGTTGLETKDLIMDNLVSNYKQADKATGQIILDDVTATLGNIYVQGSSLTGSGALKAAGDAGISVIDSAPDSIKLGNMTITDGGRIYFNNNEIKTNSDMNKLNAAKDGGTANFQTIVNRDTSNAPVINVESNFQASTAEYQKVVYNSDHTSYFTYNLFAAPSITVATGKTLLNAYGSVRLHSNEGDIHNNGAINAGSIDINANDGDFIQSYSSGTYHVGGDPEAIYDNGKWDGTVGGITANGNIYVNAQYLNINGKIQSGIADWTLDLPADVNSLKVTYKQNGTTVTKTIGSLTDEEKAYTLHLSTDYGNMAPYVVYDSANKKLVVDNVNIHGGNVTLVGTIMNTGSGINKANGTVTGGSVIALDGYGQINLTNQSGLPLEIRNVSADTAENGVKGSIIISDIDRSGSMAKVTTYKYTRENGVQKVYLKQSDGSWQDVTSTTSATSFAPQANLVYTKMAGTTTNTVRSYYESKFKLFDWITVHSGDPEALLISTSTGENLNLSKAGYVQAGYLNKPTEAYFLTHDATPFISPSDTTVKKDAAGNITASTTPYYVWMAYQINANTQTNKLLSTTDYLILKKYQYTWDETTSTNNYEAKTFRADNPIAIGYVGSETPGNISIASNSSINLAGTLSNKAGNIILSAKDGNSIQAIKPTEVINANSLTFDTTGAIGSADLAIQTRTNSLASLQKSASLYVKNISTADMALGSDIAVSGVATLTSGGSITDADGHTISAQRLNLRAEGGTLGTAAAPIKFGSGAPEGGKNVDYGISASAQSDVYLSTSGEALVDHIDSNEGNVWLYAKQGIYDNNTNESTNESVADKLLNWKNLGVLEGTEELLSRQKEILKNEVVNEYKAYLYYKGVLANEKALSTTEQADYDYLIAKGLDKWTKAGVEAYTPTVTKTANGINYVYSYTDDGFLTAGEQKELLTGTAVTENELLLTLAPGLESGVTDTNPVIKAYANIKGNDITLLTGTSVGDRSDKLNFTVDLTKSLKTYAESAEGSSHLLALATAEKGDATTSTDGSTFTASVYKVSPVEVDAKGTVTTKFVDDGGSEVTPAAKNDVYLVAETTDPTVVGNISGDRVRIKTVGDLTSAANTAVSANQADLILESAEGRVNVNIGKTVGITSRSGSDIVLNGTGTDIPVDMIYAANSVTINSGAADILGLEGDKGVNIRANNVQLNGNHVGTGTNTLGLTLTDTATASNITAQNGIDLYLAKMAVNFGSLDSTAGDIVIHSDDDVSLQAGTINAAGDIKVSAGSIDVGTVQANTATLNAGTDLTATGAIHTSGDSILQAVNAIKVTDVTSDTGNINAVAGDNLTGNTLTALNGDIHLEAGSINVGTINAGKNVTGTTTKGAVTTGSVTAKAASLTAKTDLTATGAIHTTDGSSLQAGNNMALTDVTSDTSNINAVAGDNLTGNTLTALNGNININAGSIKIAAINTGHQFTGSSTQGDLAVDRLTADTLTLDAKGDIDSQAVSATHDVMLKAGNNLNLGSVTSTNGSFDGSAGKSLIADTVSAVNGKVIASGQVIDINHLYSGDISGYGEDIDLPHVSYSGDGPIRIQLQGEDGSTAQSVKVNVDESLRGVIYDHLKVEDGSLSNNTDMATLNDASISGDFLLTNAYIRYGRTGSMPNSTMGNSIDWLALIGRGTSFGESTYIYRNSNGLPLNNQYFYNTVEYTATEDEKHVRDWWTTMQYDEAGKQQPFIAMTGRAQLFIDNPVVRLGQAERTDGSDKYLWHW
jgi:exonuclease VII small subunit